MKAIAAIFLLASSLANAANHCRSNDDLLATGWIHHDSAEFLAVKSQLQAKLKSDASLYIKDLETDFDSPYLFKRMHFQSWDDLRTPDLEMMGDIVFYFAAGHPQPIEIRWYENKNKHFVTASNECSCDDAPTAENALF